MVLLALFPLLAAITLAPTLSTTTIAEPKLSIADQTAAFKAAGFTMIGKDWRSDCDTSGAAYTAGAIETVRDVNGDGLPEVVVTEGSTYCYGMTGAGYVLVSKQANGRWKRITSGAGIPTFLDTKGVGGWPDIEVGGPGFCFPVQRWNGKEYVLDRHSYEGNPCEPQR
jgi:hypothetical protein